MHVTIDGKGLRVTSSLRAHISQKMERVKAYTDKIIAAHFILQREHLEYTAEIIMMLEGKYFRLAKKAPSVNESIDLLVDAIERKLRKTKERVKDHKHDGTVETIESLLPSDDDTPVETLMIKIEEISFKPMDPVEALLQLDVSSSPHLAFFRLEKNKSLMNVKISKHPVFLVKRPDSDDAISFIYKEGGKNIFSKRFFGYEGWVKRKAKVVNGKELKTYEEKKIGVPEFSIPEATERLQDEAAGNFMVFQNGITGKVEGIYKESKNKYTVLRYADHRN